MRTLILFLAILLLASAAQGRIPAKFVGHWCANSNQLSTFTRGRCRDPNDDGQLTVNANGFRGFEDGCKVRSASALRQGRSYHMKLDCGGEGLTWNENSRMSLDNEGRLKLIRGRPLNERPE